MQSLGWSASPGWSCSCVPGGCSKPEDRSVFVRPKLRTGKFWPDRLAARRSSASITSPSASTTPRPPTPRWARPESRSRRGPGSCPRPGAPPSTCATPTAGASSSSRSAARRPPEEVSAITEKCRFALVSRGIYAIERVLRGGRCRIRPRKLPCGRGGTGRHARFRIWCRKAWGFESLRPHQRPRTPKVLEVFSFTAIGSPA